MDSRLFKEKNIIEVSSFADFGRAEEATLFLVYWPNWQPNETAAILKKKDDKTALVIYAPPGAIPKDKWDDIDLHRNVTVANFRGRLLNDIVTSLITTHYQK